MMQFRLALATVGFTLFGGQAAIWKMSRSVLPLMLSKITVLDMLFVAYFSGKDIQQTSKYMIRNDNGRKLNKL